MDVVKAGEDVLVTERGRPVARVIGPADTRPLDRLAAQGRVRAARTPKTDVRGTRLVRAKGSVSDLVTEQRR
jgi:prevent-host-death family protein